LMEMALKLGKVAVLKDAVGMWSDIAWKSAIFWTSQGFRCSFLLFCTLLHMYNAVIINSCLSWLTILQMP
jgi:hypothetical protein